MRKYKVVILNRIDRDNLIVKAKSLNKTGPIIDKQKDSKLHKAPKWFQEFEKRNNERWDKQEQFNRELRIDVNDLKVRMISVETTVTTIIKLNNLITK